MVIEFCTLSWREALSGCNGSITQKAIPVVFVEGLHFYHIFKRKHESLEGNIILVFDHNNDLVNITLHNAPDKFDHGDSNTVHQNQLFPNRVDSTGNVLVQAWMTGLKNRRVVLFPTYEKICRVDLSYIQDGVDRNLDYDGQLSP
jgi:hypothetical protein